jgi:hypothetical protein
MPVPNVLTLCLNDFIRRKYVSADLSLSGVSMFLGGIRNENYTSPFHYGCRGCGWDMEVLCGDLTVSGNYLYKK